MADEGKAHPHGASDGAGGVLLLWPQLCGVGFELRELGSSGASIGGFGPGRGNSWRGGSFFRRTSMNARGMQSSSSPSSALDTPSDVLESGEPLSPRVRPPSAAEMQVAASNVAFSSTAAVPAPQAWQRALWLAVEVSLESEAEAAAAVMRAAAVEAAARAAAAVSPALSSKGSAKDRAKEMSVPMLAPQDINGSGALYARGMPCANSVSEIAA